MNFLNGMVTWLARSLSGFVHLHLFICVLIIHSVLVSSNNEHVQKLKFLQSCGFNPTAILDIGANFGGWTAKTLDVYPKSKFLMVEGNDYHIKALTNVATKGDVKYDISLVSDVIKNVTFFVGGDGSSGSTLLREASIHKFEEVVATAYDLNTIIKRNNFPPAQLLKIDIQGAELLALKGASEILPSVEVIILEVALLNFNIGQPSFYHLYRKLHRENFELYSFQGVTIEDDGTLLQADTLFVRTSSPLWNSKCTGFDIKTAPMLSGTIGAEGFTGDNKRLFNKLKNKCGFEPSHIVDVGASDGQWSRELLNIFPSGKYLLIDGNTAFSNDLKKLKESVPNIAYDIAVVSDRERFLKLYVGGPGNERSLVSTIFKHNTVDTHVSKRVNSFDLDSILKRNSFPAPTILKLDIQGAEYMALMGAPELLKHVSIIVMEAITQPLYNSQQPALFQIYKKLFNENFEIYDISGVTQAKDAFIQADVVFIRRSLKELWGVNCTGFPIPKYFHSVVE